jgi:hypothetical protein
MTPTTSCGTCNTSSGRFPSRPTSDAPSPGTCAPPLPTSRRTTARSPLRPLRREPARRPSLLLAAKAHALLDGRFAVALDDLRAAVLPSLRHRFQLNFEGVADGSPRTPAPRPVRPPRRRGARLTIVQLSVPPSANGSGAPSSSHPASSPPGIGERPRRSVERASSSKNTVRTNQATTLAASTRTCTPARGAPSSGSTTLAAADGHAPPRRQPLDGVR